MPKFRVSVSYDITTYETYEVEISRSDYDSDDIYQEELEGFEDSPYDWCDETTRTKKEEGDVRNGSWDEDIEEINALEQMATALAKADDVPTSDDTAPDEPEDAESEAVEHPHGVCEHCNGTGKILIPVDDNKA